VQRTLMTKMLNHITFWFNYLLAEYDVSHILLYFKERSWSSTHI